MLEPASIAKLITTTAAFRAGLDPDQEIEQMVCRGAKRYSGGILYCGSHKEEFEGLVPAMATSCNIAFADLGIKLGWESLLAEQRIFGFGDSQNTSLPLGRIIINQGNDRKLADLSIGLENTVTTPLHSAMIAAVFGNDGHLVVPHLIWGKDGLLGYSPQGFEKREARRIIKREWLPLIKRSMEAVTNYGGTAGLIAPYDFPVAMKTGTAATYRRGFHINYIGYAPANDPQIAFCVRVTNKRRSVVARRHGYRVTHSLLIKLRNFFQNP
jgi:peptidoglycan glycosyltransferase